MSAGLKGDLSKLRGLEQRLRELPRVVAIDVAAQSASTITSLALRTFDAGENAYGDTWEPGAQGQRVDLRATGALASGLRYVATGTRLRAALTVSYAKFQLGKRPVFPRGGSVLPTSYREAIAVQLARVVKHRLGVSS